MSEPKNGRGALATGGVARPRLGLLPRPLVLVALGF